MRCSIDISLSRPLFDLLPQEERAPALAARLGRACGVVQEGEHFLILSEVHEGQDVLIDPGAFVWAGGGLDPTGRDPDLDRVVGEACAAAAEAVLGARAEALGWDGFEVQVFAGPQWIRFEVGAGPDRTAEEFDQARTAALSRVLPELPGWLASGIAERLSPGWASRPPGPSVFVAPGRATQTTQTTQTTEATEAAGGPPKLSRAAWLRRLQATAEAGHAVLARLLGRAPPVDQLRFGTPVMREILAQLRRNDLSWREVQDASSLALAGLEAVLALEQDALPNAPSALEAAARVIRGLEVRFTPVLDIGGGQASVVEPDDPHARWLAMRRRRRGLEGEPVPEPPNLLRQARARAREFLFGHRTEVERVRDELLTRGALDAAELEGLLGHLRPLSTLPELGHPEPFTSALAPDEDEMEGAP